MKLYSRGQVLFFSLLSALIVLLFAFGFGFFKLSPPVNGQPVSLQITEHEPEFKLLQTEYNIINTADLIPYSEDERQNITIYERLNSGVVNITTETMAINWFLEPVPQEGSSGSGSIIDTRGYVLTNNHVIENAHRVFISLSYGSQFEGTIIGTDP